MQLKLDPLKVVLGVAAGWVIVVILGGVGQLYAHKIAPRYEKQFVEEHRLWEVREQAAAGDPAAVERHKQLENQRQQIRDPRGLVSLFNVDGEARIPALYQTLTLLALGILLWVLATHKKRQGDSLTLYWRVLSIGFLYLAVDEACGIHEHFYFFSGQSESQRQARGFFYYSWTLTALIIIGVVGLVFLRFLLRIPRRMAIMMIVAGGCYVMGAVGLEMIAGKYLSRGGEFGLSMSLLHIIEETLEMAGLLVFMLALLRHAGEQGIGVQFAVRESLQTTAPQAGRLTDRVPVEATI